MRTIDANEAPRALEEGEAEELEARLRDAVRLEPLALEEEFVRIPSDIAYWTSRHARAIGAHLRATARKKRLWGLLRVQAQRELEEEELERCTIKVSHDGKVEGPAKPPKKYKDPTVDAIDARVESYPEWRTATDDEADAEVERERLKGAVLALIAKRDMLVQMGANHRAEMERDPVIREKANQEVYFRSLNSKATGNR